MNTVHEIPAEIDNLVQSPKSTRDTKSRQRFLDAAEWLFAERGYEGAKIRAIAKRSEVNLGALHHYWGNKEELFRAVCQRRLVPMNSERLGRFDELEKNANGGLLDTRELFRASLEPTFFLSGLSDDEQIVFRKFYGRALTEPYPVVSKVMGEIFRPISTRFLALLRPICAHLTDNEFYWRTNCIFAAYLFVPAFTERVARYAHPEFDINDVDTAISQIVEFLVAGMMAPSLE